MIIISELTGGLGNQLFQYAVGFSAARRIGASYRLDLRHFDVVLPNMPSRPFALQRLAISAGKMSEIDRLCTDLAMDQPRRAVRWLKKIGAPRLNVIVDKAEGHDPRVDKIERSTYLKGCWQTEKFFADQREQLLREFTFKNSPSEQNRRLLDDMKAATAISVHFRRTDYLHAHTLTRPCSLDYYARAFATMQSRFPNATYYVFTDDPDWVRQNATLPSRSTIVAHNTGVADAEDLRLMMHCDHFVIANSSFSWWGAWLSRNPDKQVIAPAVWFEDKHASEGDLVPAAWSRL